MQDYTIEEGIRQASPPASDESVKEATPEQTRKELNQAIEGSKDILVAATTTLMMVSDKVVLDRAKLTITKRKFFSVSDVVSIRIEDILNVTMSTGPILGNIEIASRVLNSGPYVIGKFWRADALRLKRIIQGYVIALQRNIDCSSLSVRELRRLLHELGNDEHSVVNM